MQTYAYTARDESGSPVNGRIQAASIGEVSQQLRATGKYPISIKPVGAQEAEGSARPAGGIRISRSDVIQIAQQLAIMMETGVTLAEALACISQQSSKPNVKRVVNDLETEVQSGSDFSSALAKHPRSFPRIFIALVKAAEKSGMLSKLLTRATQYMRDEQETIRKVRGALIYPGIMLGFAVATTTFLLAFVLPKFTVIYANKGAALPVPTKVLMAMSDFLVANWMSLLIGLTGVGAGLVFCLQTERGRRAWHTAQLRIPLLGKIFRKLHLSRGLRMIGTMAGAGVNLVDCVTTAQDLCSNVLFRQLWDDVSLQIQSGKQMSEPLSNSPLVPRPVAHMIHSGEKSGKLAQVTETVAGFAEQELKETITEMTRYIEPAMIIIMGFIIGGVALAMMLPIFTISRVVAR